MATANLSVMLNETIPFYPAWAAISMITVGTVGVFGNAVILLAIAREKSFRSRCHVLMALLALTDVVTCIYLIQVRVYVLLGDFYPNNLHCFYVSIYGLISQNLQSALGLTIGLDRFFAVFVPIKYIQWRAAPYMTMLLSPAFLYSVLLVAYGYPQTDSTKILGFCTPATAFNGPSQTAWIGSNGVIIILVIVTYTSIAVKLHMSTSASTAASKRIIGSLHLIVSVYCATWALTIFAMFILKVIAFSSYTTNFILMIVGFPAVFNSSCNFFIYAWRSTDFRAAFAKIFCMRTTNIVTPIVGKTSYGRPVSRRSTRQ